MKNITTIIIAAVVSAFIGYGVVSTQSTGQTSHVEKEKSTFEKVLERGELRCGYLPYPPGFMIDPNTDEMSGVFYEAVEEIGKNANIKINWAEENSYVALMESLSTGRIDAICSGLWLNAAKAHVVDFSDPFFFHELAVYVNSDDTRFDYNLRDMNSDNITFAVIEGALADQISSTDFPEAKQHVLPQLSDYPQLLMEVTTGKADATISATSEIYVYNENNQKKVRKVPTERPIRVFPNVLFVDKGQTDLLNFLNAGIKNLHYNGVMADLVSKYEPAPGTLMRVNQAYLKSQSSK